MGNPQVHGIGQPSNSLFFICFISEKTTTKTKQKTTTTTTKKNYTETLSVGGSLVHGMGQTSNNLSSHA